MNGGCFNCGARGSCKHREVEEPVRRAVAIGPEKTDKRRFNGHGGLAFRNSRSVQMQEALRRMRQQLK